MKPTMYLRQKWYIEKIPESLFWIMEDSKQTHIPMLNTEQFWEHEPSDGAIADYVWNEKTVSYGQWIPLEIVE